jgi:hypothetical protein
MMYPESDLAILTQELVQRDQANIVHEKEEANAKKPNHPSTQTVVKQVLAVQSEQGAKTESGKGNEAASAESKPRRDKPRGGRNTHRGSRRRGLENVEF